MINDSVKCISSKVSILICLYLYSCDLRYAFRNTP